MFHWRFFSRLRTLRGRIKNFCHLTYISQGSPAISRITVIFPQSSFPRLLYIVASSSSTSESTLISGMALISECTALARSWILEKGFPAKADLIFGKSQKLHGAKSGECVRCSIKRIPLSSRYVCVMRALWAAALSWCNCIRDQRRVRAVDWISRRTFGKLKLSNMCEWL